MIRKSVKKLLLAALAISLFAGSALAVQEPTPIELTTGSVTLGVSFDADASSVVVAKASDKTAKAFAPEFSSLKAPLGSIKSTLANINTKASSYGEIEGAYVGNANLIGYFIYTFYNSGNETLKANALKLAQALGVVETAGKVEDLDLAYAESDSSLNSALTALLSSTELKYDTTGVYGDGTKVTATLLATAAKAFANLTFSDSTLSNYANYFGGLSSISYTITAAANDKLALDAKGNLTYAADDAASKVEITNASAKGNTAFTAASAPEYVTGTTNANFDGAATKTFAAAKGDTATITTDDGTRIAITAGAATDEIDAGAATAEKITATATGWTNADTAMAVRITYANGDAVDLTAGATEDTIDIENTGMITITGKWKVVIAGVSNDDITVTTTAEGTGWGTAATGFKAVAGTGNASAAAEGDKAAISATEGTKGAAAASDFWSAASDNFAAFKLMLPDIAKWVSANPTATPAKFAAKIANDLYAPAYAAKGYVEKIASADQLAAGADFVLNWAVSTEVGYPSATPATVKVYLLKDETVTVPLAITTANLIDANKKATDIKADTKIVHAEVASKDAASKIVYGPEDITKGLVLDKAFIAAHPDLLVRVMFTSKGDQTLMTNSVGILKEGQDTIDQGGTLPDKTLTKAPVSDYVNLNPSLFTALAEGYPYFVEFPLQLAVSFDTGSGSSSETTTAETYKLKASDVVLTGSDGQSKTVAASTSYSISQDSATKDALWTAAPVVFSVSSDQFASFEITVSADANVIAAKDADGGEVTVSGKKVEVLGIEGTYTIILSSDLVASSDGTVSTDSGYFAITVDVASVSVAPVVPGETSPEVPGETSPEVPGETSPEVPGTETEPVAADAAETTTDASGNTVAAPGQPIANAFTGSDGASAVSSLINSATAAEMADAADVAGALGLDEDEIGDATKGYKAIGFKLAADKMPAEGKPLFVIVRKGSTNHVGFGYVPKRREGFETILAVLFSLFRDPADTTNYMTVEAGDNTVAATDSDGEVADASAAVNRVVFVTADGDALQVKTDGTVPLQGQDAKGAATEIEQGDDDDDNNGSTSRHGGGSSGCDAGFGLIALAAVALAARKIRK